MAETKQYKLVYEKEGELKGSYSGIPANDDTDVIKRAVLEGKEDPVTPTDPTEIYHKLVPFDLGETVFNAEDNHYHFDESVYLTINDIIELSVNADYHCPFRFIYNDKEYIIVAYDTVEEDYYKNLNNLVDIYADDPSAEEHNTFDSIICEIDAEVGTPLDAYLTTK